MKALLLFALVCLAACIDTRPHSYAQPGTAPEEMSRTLAGCRAGAAGLPNQSPENISGYIDNCMMARGYQRTS